MRKQKFKKVNISLRLEEFEELEKYSIDREISKAELVRLALKFEFENKREPIIKRVHKTINPKLLYHLNKIGNNLNQISKNINTSKKVDVLVLKKLVDIELDLKELIK